MMAEPLEMKHCWPLFDQAQHFDLGCILNSAITDAIEPLEVGALSIHHSGCWECDLKDNSLVWSGGVYDMFGIPRGASVTRQEAASLYCADSRALMERLRTYAIRYGRGFTLDAEICTIGGMHRQMRLVAAPVWENGRAVRLHGLKLII